MSKEQLGGILIGDFVTLTKCLPMQKVNCALLRHERGSIFHMIRHEIKVSVKYRAGHLISPIPTGGYQAEDSL